MCWVSRAMEFRAVGLDEEGGSGQCEVATEAGGRSGGLSACRLGSSISCCRRLESNVVGRDVVVMSRIMRESSVLLDASLVLPEPELQALHACHLRAAVHRYVLRWQRSAQTAWRKGVSPGPPQWVWLILGHPGTHPLDKLILLHSHMGETGLLSRTSCPNVDEASEKYCLAVHHHRPQGPHAGEYEGSYHLRQHPVLTARSLPAGIL
jgi:hypothetical protein